MNSMFLIVLITFSMPHLILTLVTALFLKLTTDLDAVERVQEHINMGVRNEVQEEL